MVEKNYILSVFENLEHAVFLINGLGQIVEANKAAGFVAGEDANKLKGQQFHSLIDSMVLADPASNDPEDAFWCSFKKSRKNTQELLFKKKPLVIDEESFVLLQQYQSNAYPALTSSKDYQQLVLDAIPDLLFVLDSQFRVTAYHSSGGAELLLPPDHFMGKTVEQFMPDEAATAIWSALKHAEENGTAKGFRYALDIGNGLAWYELSVRKNEESESASFIAIARDISKSIASEKALAENEARFRSFIEQSSDGIVLINETGNIILWNKGMESLSGIGAAEVMHEPVWEIMTNIATESRKNIPGAKEQLKQRMLSLLAGKEQQWIGQPIENEILHLSGETKLITTVLFPVEYNDKILFGAIHRDITAQKMSELALRENEEYIRTLYYDSPVPVLVVDTGNLKVFDLNNAAAQAFGYSSREQMLEMRLSDLLPEGDDHKEKLIGHLLEIGHGGSTTFDCEFRRKGENHWEAKVHSFTLSINERDLAQLTLIDTTTQNKAMKALFESESRYRAVAENASAGIYITNPAGIIVYANETLAGMLGYLKEELMGKALSDIMQLSDQKQEQAVSSISQKQFEARMLCKNGIERNCSVSTSAFYASDEVFAGTLGVLIDITEQKTAEKQLLETSRKMQAILDSMPDMIFIMDSEGYYLDIFINPTLYQNTEYQPKKGQHISELFSENDAKRIATAIQQSLRKKRTMVLNFDYGVGAHTLHLEARISPMGNDKVVSVVRDTTTLITLETELVYNNNLLRMLTQLSTRFINLPVSQIEQEINHALAELGVFAGVERVYIFDYDWQQDCMSNTFEWCAEGTTAEIENLQLIPNSFLPDWVASHKRGEMTYVPSVAALHEQDNLRIILEPQGIKSLITIPLMDGEICLGYVGFDAVKTERVFTDSELSLLRIFAELLTNLKIRQNTDVLLVQSRRTLEKQNEQLLNLNDRLRQQNEEILQKNRELDVEREKALASDRLKTAFLNNVSHEVRTPLNGIAGFAQFLSENNLSQEDREEFTTALNTSVVRLTDTINDIMDVSLLMSGNMKVHLETINAASMAEEISRKHQFEAKTKNLKFGYTIPEADLHFVSDYGMVKKIMDELVGNAIKYTKEGYVEFMIKRVANNIEIRVEDSGIGISETAMPKIFEPFVQEDVSSTRSYEGSGLGLTIVKGMADLINGTVEIEAHSGNGTSFVVLLPDQSVKNDTDLNENTELHQQQSHTRCILVAEDEALNVLYLKRMFKNSPYQLLFAQNGIEAIEMVEKHQEIGIILMDIKMPVMDGLEATKRIKKVKPALPIVAVTAYATNDDRHACMQAGCNEYLSKPFVAMELINMIKKYI